MRSVKEIALKLPAFVGSQAADIKEVAKYFASDSKCGLGAYRLGIADHPASFDERQDEAVCSRLIDAYHLAKKRQSDAPEVYQGLGEWERIIHVEYARLLRALSERSAKALSTLLRNFYRNECSRGFETNYLHRNPRRPLRFFWYLNWFSESRDNWEKAGVGAFKAEDFGVPLVGNPVGIKFGQSVVPSVAIRHRYYAQQLLKLLGPAPGGTIAEIGGGFGGLAYFLFKESGGGLHYSNFDLPEINVVNAYFLLKAFPDKKVTLYGESQKTIGDVARDCDILIYPYFCFSELPDSSMDVVFNANSLSEMDPAMAQDYFSKIKRVCGRYFMHVNHDDEEVYDKAKNQKHVKLSDYDLGPAFRTVVHKRPSFYNKLYFEYLFRRVSS